MSVNRPLIDSLMGVHETSEETEESEKILGSFGIFVVEKNVSGEHLYYFIVKGVIGGGSLRERHVVINQPAAAGNAYRW
jgi:hypothetical protein